MKKLFNFLKNHPIYCLIIVICVVFLPGAIIAKPQTESKLIIRALGIDKAGDEYQVSAIAFLPKASQSFQENYKIVEGKGRTLYDAVSAAAKETGKDIGLAHTGIVFVNDEICQEGLVESIDFLVRDYSLGNDTYVVYVPESTKELVEAAHNLAMSSGIHLGDVAGYDERKVVHGEGLDHGICGDAAPITFNGSTGSGYEVNHGVIDKNRPIYNIEGYQLQEGTYNVIWNSNSGGPEYTHYGKLTITNIDNDRPNHS